MVVVRTIRELRRQEFGEGDRGSGAGSGQGGMARVDAGTVGAPVTVCTRYGDGDDIASKGTRLSDAEATPEWAPG